MRTMCANRINKNIIIIIVIIIEIISNNKFFFFYIFIIIKFFQKKYNNTGSNYKQTHGCLHVQCAELFKICLETN